MDSLERIRNPQRLIHCGSSYKLYEGPQWIVAYLPTLSRRTDMVSLCCGFGGGDAAVADDGGNDGR